MMNTLTITPSEWELIKHRLELTDCLAEVLNATFGWDADKVEAKAEALLTVLTDQMATCGDAVLNLATMDKQTLEILKDTMDGSTYLAAPWEDEIALGHITKGQYLSAQRAAASLERKMVAAGHKVSIPRA